MNKKSYIVYMHISPSSKRYIGITCQTPNKRWQNGRGYSHNIRFTNAINKYGWDNFQHIIIAKGLDEETAKWLEIELIKVWDSTNRSKGYNISLGGDIGCALSEEVKETIGKANSKSVICLTTKRIFINIEKAKEFYDICNISKCCSGKQNSCGELENGNKLIWKRLNYRHNKSYKVVGSIKDNYNSNYNKYSDIKSFHYLHENPMSEEQRNKISETRIEKGIAKGKNNPRAKAVICITTNKIFDTVKEGAEYYGIKGKSDISKCCNGKQNYCGKLENGTPLQWKYLKDYEDYLNNNII